VLGDLLDGNLHANGVACDLVSTPANGPGRVEVALLDYDHG
jgi:hypothetical protein